MSFSFAVELSVEESGRKRPEYTLETDINGEVSLLDFLRWTKSALLVTADQILREEQAIGFDKDPVVVVDGSTGKHPANVNPLGQIEFVSRVNMTDMLLETYEGLLGRSPVLDGDYISSHYVFLNGKQIASDLASLKAWAASDPEFSDRDMIRFVNIQPYGRKLELSGVTAQRQQTRATKSKDKRSGEVRTRLRQPNGTYFLTARSIKAKYKRNTSIRFGFISGVHLGLTGSFKNGRPGKNSKGRPYLYPSITIYAQEKGML